MYRQIDTLLERWKAKVEHRLERLDQTLSREPVTPRQAWRRKMLADRALKSVENRKNWINAYQEHLTALSEVFARVAPTDSTLTDTSAKGDLGE